MAYIITDISDLVRMVDPDRSLPPVVLETWLVKEFTHSFGIPATSISPYDDLSISRDIRQLDEAVRRFAIDATTYLPHGVGADLCDEELWFMVHRDTLIIGDFRDVRKCYRLVRNRLR